MKLKNKAKSRRKSKVRKSIKKSKSKVRKSKTRRKSKKGLSPKTELVEFGSVPIYSNSGVIFTNGVIDCLVVTLQ